jgi:hypothetical protein
MRDTIEECKSANYVVRYSCLLVHYEKYEASRSADRVQQEVEAELERLKPSRFIG